MDASLEPIWCELLALRLLVTRAITLETLQEKDVSGFLQDIANRAKIPLSTVKIPEIEAASDPYRIKVSAQNRMNSILETCDLTGKTKIL